MPVENLLFPSALEIQACDEDWGLELSDFSSHHLISQQLISSWLFLGMCRVRQEAAPAQSVNSSSVTGQSSSQNWWSLQISDPLLGLPSELISRKLCSVMASVREYAHVTPRLHGGLPKNDRIKFPITILVKDSLVSQRRA